MAYYNYKRVRDSIPAEFSEPWEKAWKEETGEEYDGSADYDGQLWVLASDYIDKLKSERDAARAALELQTELKLTALRRLQDVEAECARWRQAYGFGQFGPQTPEEVQVFLEQRDHVNGQCAALKVSQAEAECARLRAELDSALMRLSQWASESDRDDAALAAEQRAHRATQRAWAMELLGQRRGYMRLGQWLAWRDGLPEPVAALVREHADTPVGTCDRCGKTAPLTTRGALGEVLGGMPGASDEVCAWGCEPSDTPEPIDKTHPPTG